MATWPYGVVGVTSTGCSPAFVDACYRTLDKTVPYIWIARSVDFADFANATMNQQIPPRLVYFASASDRDLFQQVNVTGTPAWSISGGAFLQSAESTEGFQMLADYYESVTAMVSLMAQDDDHSGMVFRYVDPDNYYLVSIRDQTNNFRIIKRKEGKDILLGQQKWVGSAVDWHQIHLTAKGDRFTALLRAGKQGGGGILTSLTVRDSEFPVGKVGLYQSSNRNASFDEFFVFSSNLPPDTQPVAQHDPNVAPRDPNVSYEQIGLLTEAWTQWFDTDDAGGTGDYEAISSIENRGHYVCGGVTPVSMQARIVGQTELMASRNEVFRMEPAYGLRCVDADQSTSNCQDYAVRFLCTGAAVASAKTTLSRQAETTTTRGAQMQVKFDDGGATIGYLETSSTTPSTTAPPGPTGIATYNFSVTNPGAYKLWGRVKAALGGTTNHDSFWVKVDNGAWTLWNEMALGDSYWHWDEVHDNANGNDVKVYFLSKGTHTVSIGYRETGVKLDELILTNDFRWLPPGKQKRAVEAEGQRWAEDLTDQHWILVDDPLASGAFIGNSDQGGYIIMDPQLDPVYQDPEFHAWSESTRRHTFNITEAGQYRIWGRIIAPSANANLVWLRVDNGAWIKWDGIALGNDWHWDDVEDAATGGQDVLVNLTAGDHVLHILRGERELKLDRFILTNDRPFVPEGRLGIMTVPRDE
jgi:hypothetical protein